MRAGPGRAGPNKKLCGPGWAGNFGPVDTSNVCRSTYTLFAGEWASGLYSGIYLREQLLSLQHFPKAKVGIDFSYILNLKNDRKMLISK